MLKKFIRYLRNTLIVLFCIIVLAFLALNLPIVQNYLAQKAVAFLSDKLQTTVTIKKVNIGFFNRASLQELYIEDKAKDTLLYAGSLDVKVTDWFFIKDQPEVTFVGLNDAYVNLYRTDTSAIWNYQFVIDAFASGEKKKKTSQKPLQWDIKKLQLHNVRMHNVDAWAGNDMIAEVGNLTVVADDIDFTNKNMQLNSFVADKVIFGLRDYKSANNYIPKKNKINSSIYDTTPFNPHLWKIGLKELNLSDSRFFLEDPDAPVFDHDFDARHMDITQINLNAENLLINADTLTGKMNLLTAKERCGIEIKKMKADVTVSPKLSECKNLYLETNRSIIGDYYAMHYNHFPDFTDYITNVRMEGRLRDATISMKDIIYFAPNGLDRFSSMIAKVTGNVTGPVSDLHATEFIIDDGTNTIAGNFSITGLPDMSHTMMILSNGNISTNSEGLLGYFPEIHSGDGFNLSGLGHINFLGDFKGLYNDFNVNGIFNTDLGGLTADVNLKNPETEHPIYSGHIVTSNFQLGKFLKQDNIGNIALDVNLQGTGFNPNSAQSKVEGHIATCTVNGYDYKNMDVNGILERRQFSGKLAADDENIKLSFDGLVDFSGAQPIFNLTAHIDHLNALPLHFTNRNIRGSGDIRLNFSGENIDNFIGDATLSNIEVWQDSTLMNIDHLTLTSLINDKQEKELRLNSNGLDAVVAGNFSILKLPSSFQYFLSYYIPEYVTIPEEIGNTQNFRYSIRLDGSYGLLNIVNEDLKINGEAELFGIMDLQAQQLTVNASIPSLSYGTNLFNDITVSSTGSINNFHVEANIADINSGNKNLLSSAQVRADIFQDTAAFKIVTISANSLGDAVMNGRAIAQNGNFHLQLLPSEFYLSNTRWNIADNNETIFGKDYIKIQNLILNSGNQSVLINTLRAPEPNQAVVLLKNIEINAINDFIDNDSLNFYGIANGTIEIKPLLEHQIATFQLDVDSLHMNDDTLGVLHVAGKYDVDKQQLQFEDNTALVYGDSKLAVKGSWCFDTTQSRAINTTVHFDNTKLNIVEPFLSGIMHNVSGNVNGDVFIAGSSRKPLIGGTLKMTGGGFTPDITGVKYTMNDGTISVSDTKVDIGTIVIKDELGNEGTVNGSVTHQNLRNWRFNLRMNSDRIQALKMDEEHSTNFYGDVKAAVSLRLTGPVDDINITITATPLKDSKLFIPISDGIDLGEYNYIHFKAQDGQKNDDKYVVNNSYHVRIDAIATPDLECTIVLDKATGDQIWAKGSGNLVLEIPSQGDIRLNGNYVIQEGQYDFAFKQLQILNYKKQFKIYSGSIIKWNGDISNADLDVNAVAQIRARLYDLIINDVAKLAITDNEIKDAQLKQTVNINMDMNGTLQNPQFGFKLDLAENRSVGTFAYQKLQRINTDENELFNQVASLLLLDQFLPPEGFNSTAISTASANNLTELVSTFASSQLTNFTNKVLGIKDLYVGVRYKNYSLNYRDQTSSGSPSQIGLINRNEAGLNLRKNFFDNRLVVEVGGMYDWGEASRGQGQFTSNFAGDFRVQYLLTEDGRVSASVFRNSNYDPIFQQNIARQGVGLNYRKSFDNILEFFKSNNSMRRSNEDKLRQKSDSSFIKRDSSFTTFIAPNP